MSLREQLILPRLGTKGSLNSIDKILFLNSIYERFNLQECIKLKQIEKITNHDVKSVEYYIREKLDEYDNNNTISNYVHFGLTSQDVNNILLSGRYDQNILDYISENRLASMYFDYNAVMVGASGAIYGVVVAFAFLFPNSLVLE